MNLQQFWNSFLTLDITTWLILIIFIYLGLSRLFMYLKKLGKIKSLKAGPVGVEFGENENIKMKNISPHSKCPHAKDVVMILTQQRKNIRKVDKIELKYIPRDLMNFAEDVLDKIISRMYSVFLTLLKEKKGLKRDIVSDSSFHLYKLAVNSSKRSILKELLRMIYENSFLEKKKNGKWDEYKKIKTTNLIDMMTEGLNEHYICDIPSREEVYNRNVRELLDPAKDFNIYRIINEALDSLVELARQHYGSIEKLESESDKSIEKLFGTTNDK